MTTTQTVHPKAEVGRRIMLTRYSDLDTDPPIEHPGIITGILDDQAAAVRIRLDGTRCNLHARSDYRGLRYLDEVTEVPALPMGRFTPVADDRMGFYDKAGVLLAVIGEDCEDLVILTDDPAKAREAAAAYDAEIGLDLDSVDYSTLTAKWAVFEWEPEDAEMPWTVSWASEGDEHAIRIHYLPA